jgi:predicted amidohydrolase
MGLGDPDADRYFRINHLINEALRARPRPDYVVLPELALPRKWFSLAAHRLAHSGVSLIAGLEYEHHGPARDTEGKDRPYVSNQVWSSLTTDLLGYPSLMIYAQEKERPAPGELDQLLKRANKELKPILPPVKRSVIQHGNFHFGILICSELTNIRSRAEFRGVVDALIVPEWNRDINSFSSLVEASALDVHCFMIQVNNRQYGDCRVRAPYTKEFLRDIARVKGGKADYYVLAELDVPSLRAFQSQALSPDEAEFKPKPDGFEMNPRRRRVPGT